MIDGVVRWRRKDLARWPWRRSPSRSTRPLGRELKALGFAKISARPRHYAQNELAVGAFKKNFPAELAKIRARLPGVEIELWWQDEARIGLECDSLSAMVRARCGSMTVKSATELSITAPSREYKPVETCGISPNMVHAIASSGSSGGGASRVDEDTNEPALETVSALRFLGYGSKTSIARRGISRVADVERATPNPNQIPVHRRVVDT